MLAADFFTVEALTVLGLVRYHVLFFVDIVTRRGHLGGIVHEPDGFWMKQPVLDLTNPVDGFLRDGDLRLRPLRLPKDIEVALPWYADPEVLRLSEGVDEPYSAETVAQMFDVLSAKGEVFIIEVDTPIGWRPVGDVTLSETGIPITIGDPEYRSRGFGTRTLALLIDRARALRWDKLVTNPIELSNERSVRMFESAGFVRRRSAQGQVSGGEAVVMEKTPVEGTSAGEQSPERQTPR